MFALCRQRGIQTRWSARKWAALVFVREHVRQRDNAADVVSVSSERSDFSQVDSIAFRIAICASSHSGL